MTTATKSPVFDDGSRDAREEPKHITDDWWWAGTVLAIGLFGVGFNLYIGSLEPGWRRVVIGRARFAFAVGFYRQHRSRVWGFWPLLRAGKEVA